MWSSGLTCTASGGGKPTGRPNADEPGGCPGFLTEFLFSGVLWPQHKPPLRGHRPYVKGSEVGGQKAALTVRIFLLPSIRRKGFPEWTVCAWMHCHFVPRRELDWLPTRLFRVNLLFCLLIWWRNQEWSRCHRPRRALQSPRRFVQTLFHFFPLSTLANDNFKPRDYFVKLSSCMHTQMWTCFFQIY